MIMTLDNEATSPAIEEPAHAEEVGRPDAPRTWTTPELVRLHAGATGNQNSFGAVADGGTYFLQS
jgi:hypothetical protein